MFQVKKEIFSNRTKSQVETYLS